MKRLVSNLIVCVLALHCASFTQQHLTTAETKQPDTLTEQVGGLKVVSVVPLSGLSVRTSIIAPFRCDGDGNLYFRAYQPKSVLRVPITKYNKSGALEATFSVAEMDQKAQGRDFFITSEGDVFQIIQQPGENFIAAYKKDGSLKSKIKIQGESLRPTGPFAVFTSGEFLISGTESPMAGGTGRNSFVAIFRSDGTFLKKITMPSAESTGEQPVEKPIAIDLSDSVAGSDGNVYVLRRSLPAKVFAISRSGEITKTLTVNGTVEPENIYESNGKLAVLFGLKKGDLAIKVIDLQSGNETASYKVEPPLGPMMFCYSGSTFNFMSGSNGSLAIFRAEPL